MENARVAASHMEVTADLEFFGPRTVYLADWLPINGGLGDEAHRESWLCLQEIEIELPEESEEIYVDERVVESKMQIPKMSPMIMVAFESRT